MIHQITSWWHHVDHVTFITDDFGGIVEIIYPKDGSKYGYIYNLHVNFDKRRKGYATALLNAAEKHVASRKRDAILTWDYRDTPPTIYNWYKKRGYKEISQDDGVVELKKILTSEE